jgi:hypothetical protein
MRMSRPHDYSERARASSSASLSVSETMDSLSWLSACQLANVVYGQGPATRVSGQQPQTESHPGCDDAVGK